MSPSGTSEGTFIYGLIVACLLMNIRKSIPLLLVTLLLVQSLMSITVQNVEATMGRGGTNDVIPSLKSPQIQHLQAIGFNQMVVLCCTLPRVT